MNLKFYVEKYEYNGVPIGARMQWVAGHQCLMITRDLQPREMTLWKMLKIARGMRRELKRYIQ